MVKTLPDELKRELEMEYAREQLLEEMIEKIYRSLCSDKEAVRLAS